MTKLQQTAQQRFETEKRNMLVLSIFMDIVGMLSYIIPIYAESIDFVWSPIAAIVHFFMLRGKLGTLGAGLTFVEELLPATDILPSFLIMWAVKYVIFKKKTLTKLENKE